MNMASISTIDLNIIDWKCLIILNYILIFRINIRSVCCNECIIYFSAKAITHITICQFVAISYSVNYILVLHGRQYLLLNICIAFEFNFTMILGEIYFRVFNSFWKCRWRKLWQICQLLKFYSCFSRNWNWG